MKMFALIGYPLGHSYSAEYFNTKFKREGIDAEYKLLPIPSLDDLEGLLQRYPELVGFNVTTPFKQTIIPYLNELTKLAHSTAAVNTIYIKRLADETSMIGHNTDVIGFRKSLENCLTEISKPAMILGSGGASLAAISALRELGVPYIRVCRSIVGENDILFSDLNYDHIKDHTLIINTTPLGMFPDTKSKPSIPYDHLTSEHFLFDMVYNPDMTAFMKEGVKAGARVCNGLDMLYQQADSAYMWWERKRVENN